MGSNLFGAISFHIMTQQWSGSSSLIHRFVVVRTYTIILFGFLPSFCRYPINCLEKYSFSSPDLRHMIFLSVSLSIKLFSFKKQGKTLLLFSIGKTQVCLEISSMKETKYWLPPGLTFCAGPHRIDHIEFLVASNVLIRERKVMLFSELTCVYFYFDFCMETLYATS